MSFIRSASAVAAATLALTLLASGVRADGATEGPSAQPSARTTPQLTIARESSGVVETGSEVSFTGTAPASLDGKRVTLQRRVGKKGDWIKTSTAVVADGAMKATGVSTGVGTNSWRFTAKVDGTRYTSKPLTHKVYGWFYLADLDRVDYDGAYADSWVIGGKTYSKSVGGSGSEDTDWAEYNLSYRCITLDAWIGIGDDSETGTTADFYVTLDGARTGVGSKGLGPATHLTLDTSTRLRVRLEMDPTNQDFPDGSWAFGNAKVLCSGKP